MSMHRPPSEPEIIPPERGQTDRMRDQRGPWVSVDVHGTRRVYVGRVGPLGIILLALLIGTLAAVVFVVVLGAFLIWVPVAMLLFAAAILGGILRRHLRR